MAPCATVRQACSNLYLRMDIPPAVANPGPLTFFPGKFPLEKLSSAADCPEGVPFDDEQGGLRCHNIATPCTNLVIQRLLDTGQIGLNLIKENLYQFGHSTTS